MPRKFVFVLTLVITVAVGIGILNNVGNTSEVKANNLENIDEDIFIFDEDDWESYLHWGVREFHHEGTGFMGQDGISLRFSFYHIMETASLNMEMLFGDKDEEKIRKKYDPVDFRPLFEKVKEVSLEPKTITGIEFKMRLYDDFGDVVYEGKRKITDAGAEGYYSIIQSDGEFFDEYENTYKQLAHIVKDQDRNIKIEISVQRMAFKDGAVLEFEEPNWRSKNYWEEYEDSHIVIELVLFENSGSEDNLEDFKNYILEWMR